MHFIVKPNGNCLAPDFFKWLTKEWSKNLPKHNHLTFNEWLNDEQSNEAFLQNSNWLLDTRVSAADFRLCVLFCFVLLIKWIIIIFTFFSLRQHQQQKPIPSSSAYIILGNVMAPDVTETYPSSKSMSATSFQNNKKHKKYYSNYTWGLATHSWNVLRCSRVPMQLLLLLSSSKQKKSK